MKRADEYINIPQEFYEDTFLIQLQGKPSAKAGYLYLHTLGI
ncbi:MAG: hypothetical protein N3D82_02125 [Ignisphaera sp.]|nr:hypothetical protein [Ignisphaera sp.]MCX8167814.1 hypothetical protein [Ignisphaera sp.]MDW8085821.1 hypothetical protein [Ignisphaera sp.]